MAKQILHLAHSMDGNDTVTYTVLIPKGTNRKDQQILVLSAALEALGWDGPFDGEGMDV